MVYWFYIKLVYRCLCRNGIILKPWGKFETGSKTALPIFKKFVQRAVKKSDARPFKVSKGITMMGS